MLASNSLFSTSMLLLWVCNITQLYYPPYIQPHIDNILSEKSQGLKNHQFIHFSHFQKLPWNSQALHTNLSRLIRGLCQICQRFFLVYYKKKKVLEASRNEENVPQNFGILPKLLSCKGQKKYPCFVFPMQITPTLNQGRLLKDNFQSEDCCLMEATMSFVEATIGLPRNPITNGNRKLFKHEDYKLDNFPTLQDNKNRGPSLTYRI